MPDRFKGPPVPVVVWDLVSSSVNSWPTSPPGSSLFCTHRQKQGNTNKRGIKYWRLQLHLCRNAGGIKAVLITQMGRIREAQCLCVSVRFLCSSCRTVSLHTAPSMTTLCPTTPSPFCLVYQRIFILLLLLKSSVLSGIDCKSQMEVCKYIEEKNSTLVEKEPQQYDVIHFLFHLPPTLSYYSINCLVYKIPKNCGKSVSQFLRASFCLPNSPKSQTLLQRKATNPSI